MTLCARLHDGEVRRGQVDIHFAPGIDSVWVEPAGLAVGLAVKAAILDADLIVVGPGSLFTSVLAALVHPGVVELLENISVPKVFVANLREQRQETIGLSVMDQIRALDRHGFVPDVVIADGCAVELGDVEEFRGEVYVEEVALSGSDHSLHDPSALRRVLKRVMTEQGGRDLSL
jgi:uncharacterized cofD-like protein